MALHLHRAERTDLLADGLGALLADPQPDPFAQELVLVAARGVERWLSQRLSLVLGCGPGRADGVCAGIAFRNPQSLIAEITGTLDDDPWSPEALAWPLLAVIDASLDEPWCRTLASHLGHFATTDAEAELRRGRRYSVARRLAGLFASYARQRPGLLAAWLDGDLGELPGDLAWQPPLWRALVTTVGADPPHVRHDKTIARLRDGPADLPARLSLFGHTRLACTDVQLLDALAVHHDLHLCFDTASRIESRYFASLVTGQVAKNMMQAFFFDLQAINAGGSRPEGIGKTPIKRIGVLGAGMMGAGIAYVSAKAGYEVVLKDVSLEAAAKGKGYSEKLEAKALERGRTTQERSDALLARITPTADAADFKGVDFVIEAVFENQELKHKVFGEIEDIVEPNAILGSNTSTLPITGLATGVKRQEDFIGIHFFSPVDKMPLVEIIKGEKTSDEALARVFDYTLAIGKTPIVVNDSRGFFTSRVIGTFVNEALAMLGEGVEPASIEQAGSQAGYPAPPLQLSDELNLELMHKIAVATRKGVEDAGGTYQPHPAEAVVEKMIELGRSGRLKGAGFYEYADGKRSGLWPGLRETFKSGSSQPPLQDMIDRMLFAEALETQKCLDEGVLTSTADANIGSIMGIGFPPWTGGSAQFIVGYSGPAGTGKAAFVARARELAAAYGDRFLPPESLLS